MVYAKRDTLITYFLFPHAISYSYTMIYPPVREIIRGWIISRTGEQAMVCPFYTTLISADLAQYEIFRAIICDFLASVE